MSRVQYSFDHQLAETPTRTARSRAAPQEKSPRRRAMRQAMEAFGLFAFGFGSTNLLIHFVVGSYTASRMASALSLADLL